MNLPINSIILDIIVGICLLVSIGIGIYRGFSHQFVMFIGKLITLLISYFASNPVSKMLTFIKLPEFTSVAALDEMVNSIIYRVIAFIGLYILISCIFYLLRSLLTRIIDLLSKVLPLVGWVDKLLGAALSLIKTSIGIYLVLLLMAMPMFANGREIIEDTQVATRIYHAVPAISEEFVSLDEIFNTATSTISSLEKVFDGTLNKDNSAVFIQTLKLIKFADDTGLLTEANVKSLETAFEKALDSAGKIDISEDEAKALQTIIDAKIFDEALNSKIKSTFVTPLWQEAQ